MTRLAVPRRALVLFLLAAPNVHADAGPRAASLEHYQKGRTAYAAGSFEIAIAEFERAYDAFPAPEYLHDIGQAYRRLEKCEALAYFERYLADKPTATNREDVERVTATLRDRCVPPTSAASTTLPATTSTTSVSTTAKSRPTSDASIVRIAPRDPGTPYVASASTGLLFVDAGPIVIPAVPQLEASARRIVHASRVVVEAGVALSVAAIPYDHETAGTTWLVSPQLVAHATYPMLPRFSLAGAARFGALVIAGLDEGNPYTADAMSSSPLATVSIGLDLGLAWEATDRIDLHVSPVGVRWSPRRAPLADDVPSLRTFAISAGISVGL